MILSCSLVTRYEHTLSFSAFAFRPTSSQASSGAAVFSFTLPPSRLSSYLSNIFILLNTFLLNSFRYSKLFYFYRRYKLCRIRLNSLFLNPLGAVGIFISFQALRILHSQRSVIQFLLWDSICVHSVGKCVAANYFVTRQLRRNI
jgi:hypothetical protein